MVYLILKVGTGPIKFLWCIFGLSLAGNALRWYIDNPLPSAPKMLLNIKAKFENGKPPRRYWDTLRAEPMFDEHYRAVPGRLSCTVAPSKINNEAVWNLRIGFKTTANSKPSKYINIPVYKNGKIYDQ